MDHKLLGCKRHTVTHLFNQLPTAVATRPPIAHLASATSPTTFGVGAVTQPQFDTHFNTHTPHLSPPSLPSSPIPLCRWDVQGGASSVAAPLSAGGGVGRNDRRVTFAQIEAEGLASSTAAEWVTVRAADYMQLTD